MGKLKVYELAKEMNLSNTEMLEKINKLGINVKSHLSTLEESEVNKIKGIDNKKAVKEEKKQEQLHIIRRNVRVINSSEEGKEVKEITTNATGDIKRSSQSVSNKTQNNRTENKVDNRNNNQNKNRNNSFDRRNRFQNNRNNIVITRNGKPVEKVEPKVEVKEPVLEPKVQEEIKPVEKVEAKV